MNNLYGRRFRLNILAFPVVSGGIIRYPSETILILGSAQFLQKMSHFYKSAVYLKSKDQKSPHKAGSVYFF